MSIRNRIFNSGSPGAVPPAPSSDAFIAARAVLYDREQVLSDEQKTRARENIGAGVGFPGPPGPPGENFRPDATGLLADRGDYDTEDVGFSFLATDTGDLYFREDNSTPAVAASATFQMVGILPNDEITIDGVTYRFAGSMTMVNDILVGADDDETLANLANAITNGSDGGLTSYIGTAAHPNLTGAGIGGEQITVTARVAGTGGNGKTISANGGNAAFFAGDTETAGGAAAVTSLWSLPIPFVGELTTIAGLVEAGANITITGSGTAADPYVVNSEGGGGGGTVTSVSVSLSGGITGSVSNANTTPVINLAIEDDAIAGSKLASTSVIPGSYTLASITVDSKGRITSASTGSAPATDLSVTLTSEDIRINSSTGTDVDVPAATVDTAGVMSAVDKGKLDGIESSANNYTLPIATTTVIGGVKRNTGIGFVTGIALDGSLTYGTPSGSGDVVGPAAATDNAIALFNGTTGELLKNSTLTFAGDTLQSSGATLTISTGTTSSFAGKVDFGDGYVRLLSPNLLSRFIISDGNASLQDADFGISYGFAVKLSCTTDGLQLGGAGARITTILNTAAGDSSSETAGVTAGWVRNSTRKVRRITSADFVEDPPTVFTAPILTTDQIVILDEAPFKITLSGTYPAGVQIINNTNAAVECTDCTPQIEILPYQSAFITVGTVSAWVISSGYPVTSSRTDGQPDHYVSYVSTSAATTLDLTNANTAAGRVIQLTGATGRNFTPSTGMPTGAAWVIEQAGTGVATVVPGSCTLTGESAGYKTAGQYARIYVEHIGSDVYRVIGGVP